MIAPPAMMIEAAAETLKSPDSPPAWLRESQIHELCSFGDGRAREIGASGISDDFIRGYELGLQTARAVLAQSVALLSRDIKPKDVL